VNAAVSSITAASRITTNTKTTKITKSLLFLVVFLVVFVFVVNRPKAACQWLRESADGRVPVAVAGEERSNL
jgi:hypothetical protein